MSGLKRFFVDKIEDAVELIGEEFEHAKNVLRLCLPFGAEDDEEKRPAIVRG